MVAHERLRTSTAFGSGGRAADSGGWGGFGAGGDGWGGSDDGVGAGAAGAAATTVLSVGSQGFPATAGGGVGLGNGRGSGEKANGMPTEKASATGDLGSTAAPDGVAPAASPWSSAGGTEAGASPPCAPFPLQEVSRSVLLAEEGGRGGGDAGSEDGGGSEVAIEDTYDMLMVRNITLLCQKLSAVTIDMAFVQITIVSMPSS